MLPRSRRDEFFEWQGKGSNQGCIGLHLPAESSSPATMRLQVGSQLIYPALVWGRVNHRAAKMGYYQSLYESLSRQIISSG